MMMRMLALLLSVMLLLCACVPALAQSDTQAEMLAYAVALGSQIDRMAESEALLEVLGVQGTAAEIAASCGEGSHDAPVAAVSLNADGLSGIVQLGGLVQGVGDPVVMEYIARGMSSLVPNILMGALGSDYLMAATATGYSVVFACDMEESNGCWLLLYENAVPVCITWTAQNGAVSMRATFLPLEGLGDCRSAGDVTLWLLQHASLPIQCADLPLQAAAN